MKRNLFVFQMVLFCLFLFSCNKVFLLFKESRREVTNWDVGVNVNRTGNSLCPKSKQGSENVYTISNTLNRVYMISRAEGGLEVKDSLVTGSNPSRTTVDDKGRIWIANRNSGNVTCVYKGIDDKLKYCFPEEPHILLRATTTQSDPIFRAIAAEKVDHNLTNIYVGSFNGLPSLYRINLSKNSEGLLIKSVTGASLMSLSDGLKPLSSYGAFFDQRNKKLWINDRLNNRIFSIINAATNPQIESEIIIDQKCRDQTYGIAMSDSDQMPVFACLGGPSSIWKLASNNRLLQFNLSHTRPRGVGVDINNYAWVALDNDYKVGRVNLIESCASVIHILSCNESGTGKVCTFGSEVTQSPAPSCVTYGELSDGSLPVGIGVTRDGTVYAVGHNNATLYRFDIDSNNPTAYKESVKFSEGHSYQYSDFTGFSSGYLPPSDVTAVECFEHSLDYIFAKSRRKDIAGEKNISLGYFCSDDESAIGDYVSLPEGKKLSNCVGKRCIHIKSSFAYVDKEITPCSIELAAVTLYYRYK